MTFVPDSQLVDRTLTAEAYDRKGAPILGVVIHFAEGGGTDTWLTRIDGNSSHYVIKYDGDLVQLVPETKAAGSMNPRLTRTTDDRPFTFEGETVVYGRTALNAVLGAYAPILVNRAVIAIEIEGFASAGLNPAQTITLLSLVKDIRRRRGPVGLLGHRDQQDYKACPGKRIPWAALGGHGPALVTETPDVKFIQATGLNRLLLHLPAGTPLYGFDGSTVTVTSSERDWPYVGLADARSGEYVIVAGTKAPYDDGVTRPTLLVAKTGTIVEAPAPEPETVEVTISANGKVVGTVNLP